MYVSVYPNPDVKKVPKYLFLFCLKNSFDSFKTKYVLICHSKHQQCKKQCGYKIHSHVHCVNYTFPDDLSQGWRFHNSPHTKYIHYTMYTYDVLPAVSCMPALPCCTMGKIFPKKLAASFQLNLEICHKCNVKISIDYLIFWFCLWKSWTAIWNFRAETCPFWTLICP